jgi:hypothetical protein
MQPEVPSSDQAGYMPQEPPTFTIRPATIADAALITRVISALAKFDNALHEVRTTEADILRDGFDADPHILLANVFANLQKDLSNRGTEFFSPRI